MRGPLEPRYRHYHQYLHTERLEDYRLGGYHPVNIGDRLDGNRYIIVNKLGHGDTCTVWIATDTEYGGYVALSILQARCTSEEEIDGIEQLQRLKDGGDDDIRGVSNLLLPLRFFETCGPNGTHICIVFTVQGQSVSVATKRHLGLASQVLPFQRAKSVMLDVANGLVYAHKSRLVHGGKASRTAVAARSSDVGAFWKQTCTLGSFSLVWLNSNHGSWKILGQPVTLH